MTIYATLQGNVGKDPEKRTAGNSDLASFSVATTYYVKGKRESQWVTCTVWGKQSEAIMQYVKTGSKIMVTGQLTTRESNGKTYLELNVSGYEFLGGAGDNQASSEPAKPVDTNPVDEDSIPF